MSIVAINPDGTARIGTLNGFAADGISEVGLLTLDGDVLTTPVRNNVYSRRWATPVSGSAIIALDAAGKEVFRQTIAPS